MDEAQLDLPEVETEALGCSSDLWASLELSGAFSAAEGDVRLLGGISGSSAIGLLTVLLKPLSGASASGILPS